VFFYFFVAGIATVMLGPLLPALIARWHIQDGQAGTLFTVVFVGELCGAWFATRNLRGSVFIGSCMTAAGCGLMALADFGIAHVALFSVGLGLGAGLTAGNVIVGTAATSSRTRLLALLNVSWGVGAIACSLLVRLCGPGRVNLFFLLLAGCLLLSAIVALRIPHVASREISRETSRETSEAEPEERHKSLKKPPMPLVPLLIFSLAMLLFVGIENSLGGWLPSYGTRTTTLLASSVALYFWIAELSGRLLLAALTSLFGEATLYRGSVLLLILTTAILIAATHLGSSGVVALTILSGLALAPIYPLIVSFFLARTGNHPHVGPVFAMASLGGATLPWLTGVVSTHFHTLRNGLAVPAIGAILLLLLSSEITAGQTNRQA
jgi:fucose permease